MIGALKRILYVLASPVLLILGVLIYTLYPIIGYIAGRGLQSSINLVVDVLVDTFGGTYSIPRGIKKLFKGDTYA